MNEVTDNKSNEAPKTHKGFLPFLLVFGGIVIILILIKLLINMI
ncbi:MAG TPA: hypothetical protein PLJ84_00535 [Bacteroidales bacterium]|nr:hypothetical protein [Bacteroidales bacterium]HPT01056.1 hypothetical protein [Bacteroidales bacterium]